ncbi:MAG: hypothetical protein FWC38_03245, partial [Proteobacteria bacterium]|nr:hypothetical protein [Pseudomonadota bacterium]MCL2307245.1 hypothetical protein [Pseudomonadota bacterium]
MNAEKNNRFFSKSLKITCLLLLFVVASFSGCVSKNTTDTSEIENWPLENIITASDCKHFSGQYYKTGASYTNLSRGTNKTPPLAITPTNLSITDVLTRMTDKPHELPSVFRPPSPLVHAAFSCSVWLLIHASIKPLG